MRGLRYRWVRRPGRKMLRDILGLYRAAGWWEPGDTPERIGRMAAKSHCFLVAQDRGALVAMGRAIGDRTNDAYIQDVFVSPSHRGQGVGAAVVRRMVRRLRRDGLRWVGLIGAAGTERFYERLGFSRMRGYSPMLFKRGL